MERVNVGDVVAEGTVSRVIEDSRRAGFYTYQIFQARRWVLSNGRPDLCNNSYIRAIERHADYVVNPKIYHGCRYTHYRNAEGTDWRKR